MEGFQKLTFFLLIALCGSILALDRCEEEGIFPKEHNINEFWSCLRPGSTPDLVECLDDKGFVSNGTHTGCISFEDWDCTDKTAINPPDCSDNHAFGYMHHHLNPNKFWACPEPQGAAATLMDCPKGTGFVSNKDFHGCLPWDQWVCVGDSD